MQRKHLLWLLCIAPLVVWQIALHWGHTIDDAGITFAYIDTWLSGGGLAFRPGEPPIEAYSNAMWLFTLTPFGAMGFDLEGASKVLAVLAALGAAFESYRLVLGLDRTRPGAAVITPVALWAAPLFGFWVLSGLENGLFALLLVGVISRARYDSQPPPAPQTSDSPPAPKPISWRSHLPGGLLQTALVMTRPDGALYVIFVQLWLLVSAWRAPQAAGHTPLGALSHTYTDTRKAALKTWLARASVAAALYLAYFIARYAYFGTILPNSFQAKRPTPAPGQSMFDIWQVGLNYVGSAWSAYSLPVPMAVALVAGFAWPPARHLLSLVVGCLGVGLLFPIIAGGDWMYGWRLLSFSWVCVAMVLGIGAVALSRIITEAVEARISPYRMGDPPSIATSGSATGSWAIGSTVTALIGLLLVLAFSGPWAERAELRVENTDLTVSEVAERARLYQHIAELAGIHTPRIGDEDAGGTTWKQPVGFLDLGKLGDLNMAAHYPGTHGFLRDYIYYEEHPDILHLHGAWFKYQLHDMDEWRGLYASVRPAHIRPFDHMFGTNHMAIAPFTTPAPLRRMPEASGWRGADPMAGGRRVQLDGVDLAVVEGDLAHLNEAGVTLTWELYATTVRRPGAGAHSGTPPEALWLTSCADARALGVAPSNSRGDRAPRRASRASRTSRASRHKGPRGDSPKEESPKDNALRNDAPKGNSLKNTAPKQDAPSVSPTPSPKQDAPKGNSLKQDAPSVSPKDNSPKDNALKDNAPKDIKTPRDARPHHAPDSKPQAPASSKALAGDPGYEATLVEAGPPADLDQAPASPPVALRVPIVWAGSLIEPSPVATRRWLGGVASTPLSAQLATEPCLALSIRPRKRGRAEVVAVSLQATQRQTLFEGMDGRYRGRIARDGAALLSHGLSPVEPGATRAVCTSAALRDPGACLGSLRHADGPVAARSFIEAEGVAKATERLGAEPYSLARLQGAAMWLIGAREAAGEPQTTSLGEPWRALSARVGGALMARAEAAAGADGEGDKDDKDNKDNKGDKGDKGDEGGDPLYLLEQAIRVQPDANRSRLLTERLRATGRPRVRGIEWTLRRDLWSGLHSGASDTPAADAAALLASAARTGDLLEAWRCVAQGPCAPYAEAPAVRPWVRWLRGLLGLGPEAPRPSTEREVWDFEGGRLHGLALRGEAFGAGPSDTVLPGQHQPSGYETYAYLNGFHGGDQATGTAESAPFAVSHDFVGMFVGGGQISNGVKIELLIEDKAVLTTAAPKRGSTLNAVVWDLRPWRGQVATFRITDKGKKSWGHLLVDAVTWMR